MPHQQALHQQAPHQQAPHQQAPHQQAPHHGRSAPAPVRTASRAAGTGRVDGRRVEARRVSGDRAPATGLAVHLTHRGQLAVVLVVAGLLLTVLSLRQTHSDAAGPTATPAVATSTPAVSTSHPLAPVADQVRPLTQTTVHPGDTLWAVARRIAPDRDARETVAALRALNGLADATLQAGQQLLLPA